MFMDFFVLLFILFHLLPTCFLRGPDPNGHVYQSVIPVRSPGPGEEAQALPLPRSLLLSLSVAGGQLEAASAVVLDEAHIAVVGVPHPSAGAGKGKHPMNEPVFADHTRSVSK